jgi:diguanylate cyclase (GGDEF)-like protein
MTAMDSARLLVIDHSPECAEEINSLLRNSGIEIRTNFAQSIEEAETIINSSPPLLIVYNSTSPDSAPVTEILQLAERYGLDAAVRTSPGDPSTLIEALSFHSCHAINSEQDDQLIKMVTRKMEALKSGNEFSEIDLKLEELQSRYNLLLDSSRESIAYIHEGLHVYANRAYLQLLQAGDFNDIAAVSLLEIMQSENNDLKKLLREINLGNYPGEAIKVKIRNPAGNTIDAELLFSAARYDGENCTQMMVQQVDASAVLKDELDHLRRTDAVTQLANRRTFSGLLNQFIENEQSTDNDSAVFYFEADGLQDLQDQFGVSGWDIFMSELAGVLRGCIGENDLAARFNDNGFALLASRSDKTSLNEMGERIISSLGNHILELENQELSITCSVGMSMLGTLTMSADEAMRQARSAFTQASLEGNCLNRYKPKLASFVPDEQDDKWVERIRYALDNHDLYSVQQSIVNLEGESEGLFENKTLMREEEGDLPTEQFMPVAERNNLGATIDRHVIGGLLSTIAGTGDRHIINLSTNSLLDFSFPSWFEHQLDELGVEGSQVVLQISAPEVEPNLKLAKKLADELKSVGCSLSLSSFDNQRRNMVLLDHLEVSLVKLRSGLTEGLTNNSEHQDIVRAVVQAADAKQVNVIADEVRDATDLAVLWQCGVKLVAGEFLKESSQVVGQ